MLGACPACTSSLIQPLGWRPLADGRAEVDLRCPECSSCWRAVADDDALEQLDRAQTVARAALVRAYESQVTEAMAALVDCFAAALQADLVGADDFKLVA